MSQRNTDGLASHSSASTDDCLPLLRRGERAVLERLLVCPVCKKQLEFAPLVVTCVGCQQRFPGTQDGNYDLLPVVRAGNEPNGWSVRQRRMEEWYLDLINQSWASDELAKDYAPYAPWLAKLHGMILDLGGGVGIVRQYLPRNAVYINVEPSLVWLRPEWGRLADRFPCVSTSHFAVRGIGEYLPFPDDRFDTVLAFWSLNHADEPDEVFREVIRVLKPGGRFLAVLEDMEPRWLDLTTGACRSLGGRYIASVATAKLACLLPQRSWSVADDHKRIDEAGIRRWSAPHLEVLSRAWIGRYLTYEFRKRAAPQY
jgi:SAM-dependent methyltransferase